MLVAVYLFFDPNDYKDRIAAAVKQSTGRELLLPGKLSLSIFPWIAIETGEASLGNPPGFGNEKFPDAEAREACRDADAPAAQAAADRAASRSMDSTCG